MRGLLGKSGSGHQSEQVSWATVQGRLQYKTGRLASPTLFNVVVGGVCFTLAIADGGVPGGHTGQTETHGGT